mgnify:FL=1
MTAIIISCPHCGSFSVTPTTAPKNDQCEYRCDDCGEYFIEKAPPDTSIYVE